MPATPAILELLDIVEARLGNITTANGYNYTVKTVERARMTPFKGYDLPAINYWGTSVANTKDAYNNDERELRLFVEMHTTTRDGPFIDVAERLVTDGVTALNRAATAIAGKSVGQDGAYDNMSTETDTKFKIATDGTAAAEVTCVWTGAITGALVAAQMQTRIRALGGNKVAVTVEFIDGRYVITSGTTGAASAVVITAGATLNCSDQLRLGVDNNGQEYLGAAAAPTVAAEPSYDLGNAVKDLVFDGYDYLIGQGQEPWTGVLLKFGVKYLTTSMDMINYRRE